MVFDITGAFNCIWNTGLLEKLLVKDIQCYLFTLMSSYLEREKKKKLPCPIGSLSSPRIGTGTGPLESVVL